MQLLTCTCFVTLWSCITSNQDTCVQWYLLEMLFFMYLSASVHRCCFCSLFLQRCKDSNKHTTCLIESFQDQFSSWVFVSMTACITFSKLQVYMECNVCVPWIYLGLWCQIQESQCVKMHTPAKVEKQGTDRPCLKKNHSAVGARVATNSRRKKKRKKKQFLKDMHAYFPIRHGPRGCRLSFIFSVRFYRTSLHLSRAKQ